MTEGDLDRAIDEAVREMMRVESSADVRARVLPRLRRSEPRLFTWPRLVFAAATVLLLAFALLRTPGRPTPVPEMATTPSAATPSGASPEAPATTPESASPMLQASRTTSSEFEHAGVATSQVEIAPTVPPLEAHRTSDCRTTTAAGHRAGCDCHRTIARDSGRPGRTTTSRFGTAIRRVMLKRLFVGATTVMTLTVPLLDRLEARQVDDTAAVQTPPAAAAACWSGSSQSTSGENAAATCQYQA